MKISVKSRTVLCLPTSFVINRFSAGIIRRMLQNKGIHLTKKQTVALVKEIKKYKKRHPDWNLVEVTHSDGSKITVKI